MSRAPWLWLALPVVSLMLAACGSSSAPKTSATGPTGATGATGVAAPVPTGATGATAAGGSSSKDRARYVATADGICRTFDAGIDKASVVARTQVAKRTPAGYNAAADAIEGALKVAVADAKRLRRMRAPAGDEQAVTTYLDLLDQRLAVARLSVTGLRRGNLPALAQLDKADAALHTQGERAAAAAGFRSCGKK